MEHSVILNAEKVEINNKVSLEERLSKVESFMANAANRSVHLCTSMVNIMRDELRAQMCEIEAQMARQLRESAPVASVGPLVGIGYDVGMADDEAMMERMQRETMTERMHDVANTCSSMEQRCFEMVNAMRDDLQKQMAEAASQREAETEGRVSSTIMRVMDQLDMESTISERQDECICKLKSEAQQFRLELDELTAHIARHARAVSATSSARDEFVKATMDHIWQLHKQHDRDRDDSTTRLERLEKATIALQNERFISKKAVVDEGSETSTHGTARGSRSSSKEVSFDSDDTE